MTNASGLGGRRPAALSPGLVAPVVAILRAAVRPVTAVATFTLGVAGIAGLLAGDLRTPLVAACHLVLVVGISLVAHESAHILLLRSPRDRRVAGVVHGSWTQVWVECPQLSRRWAIAVATAGPVMGALSCYALTFTGLRTPICWAVAVVHLANLLPFVGDGKVVLVNCLSALIRQPRRSATDAEGA
ncbi:hypothetical protein [Kribbella sp. CA-293567]|uniref:hypothetical protein n=1 Tax=Kribbella sp. CA-293567 TaxID=3002436 RepID=UPI0022DE37D1|nr:hypothetical protein [Kribbella sp. CA-293567]WBQ04207.1 hypothetical protein OX958_30095 [Kribbella sp. CA-293567]